LVEMMMYSAMDTLRHDNGVQNYSALSACQDEDGNLSRTILGWSLPGRWTA